MHLFIRTLTGKRIVLDVDATATIRVINRIKEKVRETTFRPSRGPAMLCLHCSARSSAQMRFFCAAFLTPSQTETDVSMDLLDGG